MTGEKRGSVLSLTKENTTRSTADTAKTDPWSALAAVDLYARSTQKTSGAIRSSLEYLTFLFYKYRSTGDSMTNKRVWGSTDAVETYFRQNPNKKISLVELCQKTTLDKTRIQYAVGRLKFRDMHITTVTRGQVWSYNPDAATNSTPDNVTPLPHVIVDDTPIAKMVFDYVGRTKRDNIIVRDRDDNLFTLNPLDI